MTNNERKRKGEMLRRRKKKSLFKKAHERIGYFMSRRCRCYISRNASFYTYVQVSGERET